MALSPRGAAADDDSPSRVGKVFRATHGDTIKVRRSYEPIDAPESKQPRGVQAKPRWPVY